VLVAMAYLVMETGGMFRSPDDGDDVIISMESQHQPTNYSSSQEIGLVFLFFTSIPPVSYLYQSTPIPSMDTPPRLTRHHTMSSPVIQPHSGLHNMQDGPGRSRIRHPTIDGSGLKK
jgi:hypothetical protein